MARELRKLYSLYQHNKDLVSIGAYQRGADPRLDLAIERYPAISEYLQQGMQEAVDINRSVRELEKLLGD